MDNEETLEQRSRSGARCDFLLIEKGNNEAQHNLKK